MFAGITTEIGKISGISRKRDGLSVTVACGAIAVEEEPGDSVAVNGVCLSVTERTKNGLMFDVVKNTLTRSNIKRLKINDKVNLESALRSGERIGGHTVTGHIDGERKVSCNRRTSEGWILDIKTLPEDSKYLADRGSVAVDGISLTVGKTFPSFFRVFLIPHTLKNTVLSDRKTGDHVNVEFDIIAKYGEKRGPLAENGRVLTRPVTRDMLEKNGFL
ncbi:MAG: riboflavin synthase [Candidatus Omnitrophota bacterium]|nr:riboflavin synthase [Candidatus Omnitrophota bacterium]